MEIIETFMSDEFYMIPEENLIDIIPRINCKIPHEIQILDNWKAHFKSKKIPFQIRKNGNVLSLWKRREAE